MPGLDRLSRSLADLIGIVGTLRLHGVGFKGLHEALDTTTPGGRLVFPVFAALAEFIRELIVEGTREGLDAARARGQRLGRPPAMTAEQIRHARDLLTRPDNTVSSIAPPSPGCWASAAPPSTSTSPSSPPGSGQLRPRPAYPWLGMIRLRSSPVGAAGMITVSAAITADPMMPLSPGGACR